MVFKCREMEDEIRGDWLVVEHFVQLGNSMKMSNELVRARKQG